jgi:Flp pilus assembly protein TadG
MARRSADSGSALLEMAVSLPLFLLVVFGLFEYSIVLFTYCNATYACRNSARYASMHSSSSLSPASVSQIQTMTKSLLFLSSALTPTVNVSYLNLTTGATATNTVGNVVEVTVSWTQTVKVPFGLSQSVSVATQGYQIISR